MEQFDSANSQHACSYPKSGKPLGRSRLSGWAKWLFPVVGVLSLSGFHLHHVKHTMGKARFVLGGVLFVLCLCAAILSVAGGANGIAHANEGAAANNPPSASGEHRDKATRGQATRNSSVGAGLPTTIINITPTTIALGQSGVVNIVMDALGTESAVGFSVNFDPTQLQYNSVKVGSGASGAFLIDNTNDAAGGQLGFGLAAEPLGGTFPAAT